MGLMTADQLQESAQRHLLLHFSKQELQDLLILERGEGPYVFDTHGRRYVDALSSLFCCQIGYSYGEEMAGAAAEQLSRLAFNTNWGTAHPPAVELAERLSEVAPPGLDRVFFTSGGSEAVEAAWKLVREHFLALAQPQRTKAIARDIAYHGVTLGALSFTGIPRFKEPFGRPAIDVTHVSNTNAFRAPDGGDPERFCARLLQEVEEAIEAAGADEVALIIAEPVQNAGGCLVAPPGYWRGLREIADRHGALLMADEVICGCGRIGEWIATGREGITPDLVSLAKGLTSAYAPMGALLATERVVAPILESGGVIRHGITFGGHPLSAAMALKNMEIFEREGVLRNVRELTPYLAERLDALRALPIVGDVRGDGFFWAVELVRDEENTRFSSDERDRLVRGFLPGRLRDAGLIARADDRGDTVVQIAPPLICDRAVLDEIVERLGEVLADAAAHMRLAGASRAASRRRPDGSGSATGDPVGQGRDPGRAVRPVLSAVGMAVQRVDAARGEIAQRLGFPLARRSSHPRQAGQGRVALQHEVAQGARGEVAGRDALARIPAGEAEARRAVEGDGRAPVAGDAEHAVPGALDIHLPQVREEPAQALAEL
jgi:adenosylmethionine-8-amino-7-oxononanoate aminotransferase